MNERALELSQIKRSFQQGDTQIDVLRGVDLVINKGELVAMVGPSGSGKSTLLQIAGLLEPPNSGNVVILGENCSGLNEAGRTAARGKSLGFVYQFHHLLPEFSALENVMMPQRVCDIDKSKARTRAEELLSAVGLGHRLDHRPAQLSGGEQQRVAIARALANRPALLLADEPTGNLDPKLASEVFGILLDLARREGLAALIATHNDELAKTMDRCVSMREGLLVEVKHG